MKFGTIFKEFCDINGYTGQYLYNESVDEYQVVITKGDNHAGAYLSPQEYGEVSEEGIQKLLELLDKGFKQKFK